MKQAVTREIAATNGGPGLTAEELAERLGAARAVIRNTLSTLVFDDLAVICGTDGRYKLGDPTAAFKLAALKS